MVLKRRSMSRDSVGQQYETRATVDMLYRAFLPPDHTFNVEQAEELLEAALNATPVGPYNLMTVFPNVLITPAGNKCPAPPWTECSHHDIRKVMRFTRRSDIVVLCISREGYGPRVYEYFKFRTPNKTLAFLEEFTSATGTGRPCHTLVKSEVLPRPYGDANHVVRTPSDRMEDENSKEDSMKCLVTLLSHHDLSPTTDLTESQMSRFIETAPDDEIMRGDFYLSCFSDYFCLDADNPANCLSRPEIDYSDVQNISMLCENTDKPVLLTRMGDTYNLAMQFPSHKTLDDFSGFFYSGCQNVNSRKYSHRSDR